jgi:hypothetical protein
VHCPVICPLINLKDELGSESQGLTHEEVTFVPTTEVYPPLTRVFNFVLPHELKIG